MKKIIMSLFLAALLFSCEIKDFSSVPLDNNDSSVFNSYFGEAALLPPVNVYAAGYLNSGGASIRLDWEAVAHAKKYNIYRSADSETWELLSTEVDNFLYDGVIFPEGVNTVNWYYQICSVNVNGNESPGSVPVSGKVVRGATFDGTIQNLFTSKGDKKGGIEVSWIPARDAAYYVIERRKGATGLVEVVNEYFRAADTNASLFQWLDPSVDCMEVFDYRITPCEQYGAVGNPTAWMTGGFRAPEAFDFAVSQGSSVRDVPGAYSVIDLTWSILPHLVNSSGIEQADVDHSPSDWSIEVVQSLGIQEFVDIASFFKSSNNGGDLALDALIAPNAALDHFKAGLDGYGLKEYTAESQAGLFSRKVFDAKLNRWTREYRYRIHVENIIVNTAPSWGRFYYFKVSSIHFKDNFKEFYSGRSQMYRGYAVDPAAPAMNLVPAPAFTAVLNGNNVQVGWNDQAGVGEYVIYRREGNDYKFDEIARVPEAAANLYEDATTEPGVTYQYSFAIDNGSGVESEMAPVSTIMIPEAEGGV